jgi:hypothetical protein
MYLLMCISGNILRDRIRNEDIRIICKIQDVIKLSKTKDEHEEICKLCQKQKMNMKKYVNYVKHNYLVKITKNEEINTRRLLEQSLEC